MNSVTRKYALVALAFFCLTPSAMQAQNIQSAIPETLRMGPGDLLLGSTGTVVHSSRNIRGTNLLESLKSYPNWADGAGLTNLSSTAMSSATFYATNNGPVLSIIGSPRGPGSENYSIVFSDYGVPGNPGMSLNTWINQDAEHTFWSLPVMDSMFNSSGDVTYILNTAGGGYPFTHWASLNGWGIATNADYPQGWPDIQMSASYNEATGPTLTIANMSGLNNISPAMNFDALGKIGSSTTNDVVSRYSIVDLIAGWMFGVSSNSANRSPGTFYPALRIMPDRMVSVDVGISGNAAGLTNLSSTAIANGGGVTTNDSRTVSLGNPTNTFYGTFHAIATNGNTTAFEVTGSTSPNAFPYHVTIGDGGSAGNPYLSLSTPIVQYSAVQGVTPIASQINIGGSMYNMGLDVAYGLVMFGGNYPLSYYPVLGHGLEGPGNYYDNSHTYTNAYPNGWPFFQVDGSAYGGFLGAGPRLKLVNYYTNNLVPQLVMDSLGQLAGQATNGLLTRYGFLALPDGLSFGTSPTNAADTSFTPLVKFGSDGIITGNGAGLTNLMAVSTNVNGVLSTNAFMDYFQAPPQTMFTAVSATPPVAWQSQWGTAIEDENSIRTNIDQMATNGLINSGMRWFVIDDCWAVRDGTTHRIQFDPSLFPSGGRALIDYAHQHGVKVILFAGLHASTSAGHAGSEGYIVQDAWDYATNFVVDGVKYDSENRASDTYNEQLFTSTMALNGRPLYITGGGVYDSTSTTSFSLWENRWRSSFYAGGVNTPDPNQGSTWSNLWMHFDAAASTPYAYGQGHFCWGLSYPVTWSPSDVFKGRMESGCIFPSETEFGYLLRDNSGALPWVTNSEVLAVNQDKLVSPGYKLWWAVEDGVTNTVWCRNLETPLGTNKAIWLTVRSTNIATTLTVPLTNIATSSGMNWASFRNPWTHTMDAIATNYATFTLTGPTSQLYIVTFGGTTNLLPNPVALNLAAAQYAATQLGSTTPLKLSEWYSGQLALTANGGTRYAYFEVPTDAFSPTGTHLDIITAYFPQVANVTLTNSIVGGWRGDSSGGSFGGADNIVVGMTSSGITYWTTNTFTIGAHADNVGFRLGANVAPTNTTTVILRVAARIY